MYKLVILIFLSLSITSCFKPEVVVSGVDKNAGAKSEANPSISGVSLSNDVLTIDGSDFEGLTEVKLGSDVLSVISNTGSSLTLKATNAIALAMNTALNLVITTAHGAAAVPVVFNLVDGSVTASKLSDMGATVGQILKYNGTTWEASDLGALTYAGNWDATGNSPDLSVAGNAGEFYIVNNAGNFDLGGGVGTNSWVVGDWAVWNNVLTRWEKVSNATSVTSFNNRNGPVMPQSGDYTWAQINMATSSIDDIADVDTSGAVVGQVLKWDGSNWIPQADATVAAGSVDSTAISNDSIVDADINATAAIAQSKISGLPAVTTQVGTNTTDIATKAPKPPTCAAGNKLLFDGTTFSCVADLTIADTDTTYSAGNGVTLTGTTFSITDPGCVAGQRVRVTAAGVGCEDASASKLQGNDIDSAAPTDGQVLTWVNANSRWEATTPASGADHLGNHTATTHLLLSNNRLVTDADEDTYFYSSVDDQIDFVVGGSGSLRLWSNALDTNTTGTFSLKTNGVGTAAAPSYAFSGDSDSGIFRAQANEIGFSTNANERLRIDQAGNVGIGRIAPAAKLDVNGKIRATEICDETGASCKDISGGWGSGGSVTSVTPGVGFDSSSAITTSGTLNIDVGTGANQIVKLDATSKLPAVDGSQLTNIANPTLSTALTGFTAGADMAIVATDTVKEAFEKVQGQVNALPIIGNQSGDAIDISTVPNCTASQKLQMSAGPLFAWSCVTDLSIANTNAQTICTGATFLDGDGNCTAMSSGSDNLGNHTATSNLNLGPNKIVSGAGTHGVQINADGHVGIGKGPNYHPLSIYKNDPGAVIIQLTSASTGTGTNDGAQMGLNGTVFGFDHKEANGIIRFNNTDQTSALEIKGKKVAINASANDATLEISKDGDAGSIPLMVSSDDNANGDLLILSSTGNLGVGTASPGAKLDVNGKIRATEICDENGANCVDISGGFSGGAGDFLKNGSVAMTGRFSGISGSEALPGITTGDNDSGFYGGASNISASVDGNRRMRLSVHSASFYTNVSSSNYGDFSKTPTFRMLNSDNLVLGESIGDLEYGWGGAVTSDRTKISGVATETQTTTTLGSKLVFETINNGGTASSEKMVIDHDGEVGIGTNNPFYALDIKDNTTHTLLRLDSSATAGTRQLLTNRSAGGSTWQLLSTGSSNSTGAGFFSIFTNDNSIDNALVISNATGNVGIGSEAPATRLSVAGGALCVSDDATCAGNTNTEGQIHAEQICDESGANCIDISAGFGGGGAGDFLKNGSVTMTGALKAIDGTAALPGYAFGSDLDTGIFSNASNEIGISTNGVERLKIDSTGDVIITGYLHPGAADGNISFGSTFPNITSGTNNIAIGNNSGANISTASNNIHIGTGIQNSGSGSSNQTVIGHNVNGLGANTVVLGNNSVVKTALKGKIGIGTTTPGVKTVIAGGALCVSGDATCDGNSNTEGQIHAEQICDESGANCVDISAGFGGGGDFMKNGSVVMTGSVKHSDGTVALPSVTFGTDTDTGFYRSASDRIGVTNGGSVTAYFGTSTFDSGSTYGYSLKRTAGNATLPTYSFTGDPDTGMYRSGNNELSFSTQGSNRVSILADGKIGLGTTTPGVKTVIAGGALCVSGDATCDGNANTEGQIHVNEVCDENGANCKDISTGWGASFSNVGLSFTTNADSSGIITKNNSRFIHDFNYGNNGTVTTIGRNTFVGYNSGNLTMGSTAGAPGLASYNTMIGYESFLNNTTGYNNTSNGYFSLRSNTSGAQNSSIGSNALELNTTGSDNSASGSYSLRNNTTGLRNTAIGFNSGNLTGAFAPNETSNNSVYIGAYSKALVSGGSNEIVIGANAVGAGSNTVVLGSDSITKTVLKGAIEASEICDETGSNCVDLSAGITPTPSGSDKEIQFNASGSMSSSSAFEWDDANDSLFIGDNSQTSSLIFNVNSSNGIYSYVSGEMKFLSTSKFNFSNDLYISNTGNIGIGTPFPSEILDAHKLGNARVKLHSYNVGTAGSEVILTKAGGSKAAPTALSNGDEIGKILFEGYAGTSSKKMAYITGEVDQSGAVADGSAPGRLGFYTTSDGTTVPSEKMIIDNAGNVGVGISVPKEKLSVSGAHNFHVGGNIVHYFNSHFNAGPVFSEYVSGASYAAEINFNRTTGKLSLTTSSNSGELNDPVISNADQLVLDKNGNVGIGSAGPTEKLHVNGNILADSYLYTSDERFKKEIRTVDKALDGVRKLRGVTYVWKRESFPDRNFEDIMQFGLIAQEVEEVYPDLVNTNKKGFKSVKYANIVSILIEAMKEQDKIVSKNKEMFQLMHDGIALKVENNTRAIASLKKENKDLKERVEKLEALVEKILNK